MTSVPFQKPGNGVSDQSYQGSELECFAGAVNWKAYFASKISPYIGNAVLEVGAGIGSTTEILCQGDTGSWTCLEPDPKLAGRIEAKIGDGTIEPKCRVVEGVVANLAAVDVFDSIIYIDVLEHIENDYKELERVSGHLITGGHLVVLSPAYSWLFSDFDSAVGHYRRYSAATLKSLTPPGMTWTRCFYLDSVGLLASAANRIWLKSSTPSERQIKFWDRTMVPLSKYFDRLICYGFGRSIVCVWKMT